MHPLTVRPPPSTRPAVSKRRHVTYAALQGEVGEPVSGLSFSHSCVEICQKREKTNIGLGPLGSMELLDGLDFLRSVHLWAYYGLITGTKCFPVGKR